MNALREKIGQMFMVGLAGERLKAEEQTILRNCPFGGFILFKHNCLNPERIRSLCDSLWKTAVALPPLIAIDQEGGQVQRLPRPFTQFPAAKAIGDQNDRFLAYRVGHAAAVELALVGINLNFAPVLDVNSNPRNPIIGARSFSSNPQQVILFSEQWIQGTRDAGIIPCGKHFPGHGDTDKDSHLDLPSVDRSLDELHAVELPPFVQACRNRIETLMTAHVIYRALDTQFPATLSVKIVNGLLREELRYDGVVFSDALEMKAISDRYGDKEASTLCVRAGVDVLLYSYPLARIMHIFEFFCNEAEKDPALQDRVEQSYGRIAKLKQRWLETFTGVEENALVERLAGLNHQRMIDAIQGSL